jgi:hypothetical protein
MGHRENGRRFERGETVVLRYITRQGGLPGMSWPYRVVEDREDVVALYIPAGTTYARWGRPEPGQVRGALEPGEWRREVLRLMFPGEHHSVWLFWSHEDGERRFSTYYVNMEEPFRRTAIGFDTNDHTLDIVVSPSLEWRWKDEDVFERLIETGSYGAEFGAAVRAEGERVVECIEGRLSPFGDGWELWAPDPAWGVPELPEGWQEQPVALWERRLWAYGGRA